MDPTITNFDFNKLKAENMNALNNYEIVVLDDSFEIPTSYFSNEQVQPICIKMTCSEEDIEFINQFVRYWYKTLVQPLLDNIDKMKRYYETSESYVSIERFFNGQTESIDLIILRCNCIFNEASSLDDDMPIYNMKRAWMRKMMKQEVSTLISADPFTSWSTEMARKFAVQILEKKLFNLYKKTEEIVEPYMWRSSNFR